MNRILGEDIYFSSDDRASGRTLRPSYPAACGPHQVWAGQVALAPPHYPAIDTSIAALADYEASNEK